MIKVTMMKKKYSKKEKRELRIKRSIMKAAKQLFSLKGYKNTTIDEITDKALIAKATLYQYFKSKENLFLETIKDSEKNLLNLLNNKVVESPSLDRVRKVRALFYYLLAYFEKDYYLIHLLFYREFYFNEEIIEFIQRFFDNLSETIQKVLGDFGFSEEEKNQLATSMIGACYLQIIRWYTKGKKESLKDVSKVLFRQFFPYLVSSRGSSKKEKTEFK
jgi:AcrR family transcriptional regulator